MPTADLGDVTLHYQRRGDAERPPALGVMGFGLDQRFWAAQIPAVTPTHSFITFDNRGIGYSTGEPVSSIDEMAADAVALLDHLDIASTVVFGVSMGGAIAQTIALDYPERVSGLLLGCTWARPIEFMRRQSALAELMIRSGDPTAVVDASLVRMFSPSFFEVGGEVIDRMVGAMFAEGGPGPGRPEILIAQLGAVDKHDVLSRLGEIGVPTLVLGARMDMMVPYFAQEEIAAAIPGAELATFETGHAFTIEELDAVNTRVSEFLGRLAG